MTTNSLSASLVICTLNRPEEIQGCIRSIAKQKLQPQQVIVVDAGDLGEVRQILQDCCASAAIEFIYVKASPSTTTQRNIGSEYVTADIIFFLDDDVQLAPDYLERILQIYQSDTDGHVGGVAGMIEPALPASNRFWHFYAAIFQLAETQTDTGTRLKPSNFPVHATKLTDDRDCEVLASTAVSYRTDVFRKHLFDAELTGYVMAEDVDLSFRVSRSFRLVATPRATYTHSRSPVSRNSLRESEKRRVLFTQYFFQKNLGGAHWRHLVRLWALFGLALRYAYLDVRSGESGRLIGLVDGIRAAQRNHLFSRRRFKPGPLDH
jgi:GT2 family glycosyltransferase